MIVGLISDTHDQFDRTALAIYRFVDCGASAIIHAGDLTSPRIVGICSRLTAYYVAGNCDDDLEAIRRAVTTTGGHWLARGAEFELSGRRIAVTHGDQSLILTRLASVKPHYLITGHTHAAHDYMRDGVRYLNPGALHRASLWSVAALDLETDSVALLTLDGPR
jgi:uncharacterized protein